MRCIKFLQGNFQTIPGLMKDLKIDRHVVKNFPVYSQGGKSMVALFDKYREFYHDLETRIGGEFLAVSKIFCKSNNMKTGISSYYVQTRDVSSVMKDMMNMLSTIEGVSGFSDNLTLKDVTRKL